MDEFEHLGQLKASDPVWSYLCYEILPSVGLQGRPRKFNVLKPRISGRLYVYEDAETGHRVVGKFFGGYKGASLESSVSSMNREFSNLNLLRGMGFSGHPHYVARPLGKRADINCLLVEEFCRGMRMDQVILSALRHGAGALLFEKLKALAYFLARLHNRTALAERIDFRAETAYFSRIVARLFRKGFIDNHKRGYLLALSEGWESRQCCWEDARVLAHGDVTPANILFGDELWVIATDLERMRYSDRVLDLGMVTGEIKHFFMQYGDGRFDPEPFIGHFLWEYACHFPDRQRAFESITRRLPYYMGLTLLRIARNTWIESRHRARLVEEAIKTLR